MTKQTADIKEVKGLISTGKEKGFLTIEEVNEALPTDMVSSDQLDNVLSIFDDMDIEIVDNEEEGKLLKKKRCRKKRSSGVQERSYAHSRLWHQNSRSCKNVPSQDGAGCLAHQRRRGRNCQAYRAGTKRHAKHTPVEPAGSSEDTFLWRTAFQKTSSG